MSAATLSGPSLLDVHAQFTAALPVMASVARRRLRYLPKRCRAEAVQDALAACWYAWHGLVRRGKDPLAVGPIGIAQNAARYAAADRQLGTGTCGRGAMDVYNRKAQKKLGLTLISLDRHAETGVEARSDAWREWLAVDNRVTPADEAAFRLDFDAWLAGLPARKRQVAELLVEGHETGVVATMLNVTPGAVSQTRTWLEASWQSFQGEAGRNSEGRR